MKLPVWSCWESLEARGLRGACWAVPPWLGYKCPLRSRCGTLAPCCCLVCTNPGKSLLPFLVHRLLCSFALQLQFIQQLLHPEMPP